MRLWPPASPPPRRHRAAEPFPSDGNLANEALQLCELPSNITVRGTLEGTVNSTDQARTVNVVPLGQYVADVTPAESPASWGALGGGGAGLQELEAQAVAVRSYVMSTYGSLQGYFGYADICDSTACQDYPGIANENAVTDDGDHHRQRGRAHARGRDGGADPVLVVDGRLQRGRHLRSGARPGDSVCVPGACNAHHTWQAQVPVAAIDSAYPQIGTLQSIGVSQRNNLGDLGGRVLQMTLQGNAGSATISGDTFASHSPATGSSRTGSR